MVEIKINNTNEIVACPRSVYGFLAVLAAKKLFEGDLRNKSISTWGEYSNRLERVLWVAGALLHQDNQGDQVVWNKDWVNPPGYEQVLATYLLGQERVDTESNVPHVGHQARLNGLTNMAQGKMKEVVDKVVVGMTGGKAEVVRDGIEDFIIGDAAVTTLLLNEGRWQAIPGEVREQLERIDLSEDKLNGWSFRQDKELTYREIENRLFTRALAAVWFEGDMEKVNKSLPLIWAVSQIYQLFSDMMHEKNRHEPTYRSWQLTTDESPAHFVMGEIRSLLRRSSLSRMDKGLAAMAVPVIWGLCRLTSKGEWEKS